MKTGVETMTLSYADMDLIYAAMQDRVGAVEAIEKKAKALKLEETEKAAILEGSALKALMNRFLTPVSEEDGKKMASRDGGE